MTYEKHNSSKVVNTELQVKEWNGQRVVTFKDIDAVHEKAEGMAKKRFANHRSKFVENEDYFLIKPADIQKCSKDTLGIKVPNRGLTLCICTD